MAVARVKAVPPPGAGSGARAKLALLELLLAEQDARGCAALALAWLARHAGVERSLCAVVDDVHLVGLAGHGLPGTVVESFRLDLSHRSHPLVLALVSGEPVAFVGRGAQAFESPLATDAFQAVPLARAEASGEIGPGLLLVAGPGEGPIEEEVTWAADLLGARLAALWYRRAQAEERRHQRERGWLLGIINAVTDPILLTDADGRILIANPGAERLLSADEKLSEGRRR